MPPSYPQQANADNENTIRDVSESGSLATLTDEPVPTGETGVASRESGEAAAIAEAIKKAGMAGPASIALRIASPLSWLGGQMLWAVQPLLQGLGAGPGSSRKGHAGIAGLVPRLATFLEGEGNIAELIAHLEAKPSVDDRRRTIDDSSHSAHQQTTDDGRQLRNTQCVISNTQYSHAPHPAEGGEDESV